MRTRLSAGAALLCLAAAGARTETFEQQASRVFAEISAPAPAPAEIPEPAHSGPFPTYLTLEAFKRLGRARIFLAKHRMRAPGIVTRVTPEELSGGRCLAQMGVEVEGVVTKVHRRSRDGDYDFEMGPLWLELTPEWRLFGPRLRPPRVGDLVRVRGWTYYDLEHEGEVENGQELSQWELHPVTSIEVLRGGARP